jgi:hypothetical protein
MGHGQITIYAACVTGHDLRSRRRNQNQGAQRPMRLGQALNQWNRHAENLKNKWRAFSCGIMEAISQEEMRICREELDQQLVTNNSREESRGS